MKVKFLKTFSWIFIVGTFTCLGCRKPPQASKKVLQITVQNKARLSKFEPANGKVILFIGQDLESIGGTSVYNNGYLDIFAAPGGFTQYTNFRAGSAYTLAGLNTFANWGDGPENMEVTTSNPNFAHSCLSIGLDITNGNDFATAEGKNDDAITRLASWIKKQGKRPVFLRIGYEFDGAGWNHYDNVAYIKAWRRIKDKMDAMDVTNVAYVWQSKGVGTNRKTLDAFYPGDKYVDWVAYSFFTAAEEHHPMIQFARDHHKPLFIAEATPVILGANGVCIPIDLSNTADVNKVWNQWFVPFFRTIKNNPDVIKAIHYINSPWKTRPMWQENPYFKNTDARITRNDLMKKLWIGEISKHEYLKASDTLFNYLWDKN
ncbi:hypothetical protein ABIB40_000205 [Pedobacter sp. UYP30]|uniref:glycosyl hydrolase n=1 Tax=Pedobacter sp. UYP30 TaxID=1756400 RepID=UPI0033926342